MAARRAAVSKAREKAESRRLNPMVEFVWQGRDKRGVVMKGEQLAKNANLLRAELRKQGITPTVVKTKSKPLFGGAKPIKPRDIAIFSRQLATMMKSGVPIVMALEIIGGGNKNQTMKKMVEGLRNDIEGGASISEALTRYPVQFDELFRNLVSAGETSGVLETVLETIANYKENMESIKGKIKKALFYPATIVAVAIIVCGILLVFVVPTFEEAFQSFGADLPAFTKLVFGISEKLVEWWWAVAIVTGAAVFAFLFFYKRSVPLQHWIDRMMLRIPVIGQVLHNSSIARFSRTLAVTFQAGVPLVEALDSVAGATGNTVYEKAVRRMKEDVAVGYPVNVAMKSAIGIEATPSRPIWTTSCGPQAGTSARARAVRRVAWPVARTARAGRESDTALS